MARVRPSQPLLPSVLDRLLDDEPEISREPPANRHQVLRDLKKAVRRDLENLLNTRLRCLSILDHCKELKKSLINYGIPDITVAHLGSTQAQEDFCALLESIIRQYEPRFQSVSVELLPNPEALDRTLHFQIDALLVAEPAPEPIVFDAQLRAGNGNFEVKGVAE
jgi:type VI secretion system protein ImpF